MKEISRSKAAQEGLKKYYTGALCKHGHDVNVKVNGKYLKKWAQATMARANDRAAR